MTVKGRRHAAIRAILEEHTGSTQEEIKILLENQGIIASQSTLSRDLREMGAIKIPMEGGGAVYKLGGIDRGSLELGDIGRAIQAFSLDYEPVGNFLVIRTTTGNAQALCVVLDRQKWHEVVGTIAGDDTILVIARTVSDVAGIMTRLKKSVEEGTL
ncbi:MAG: arginine repressor [Candidatus Latescibacterota bacterium]